MVLSKVVEERDLPDKILASKKPDNSAESLIVASGFWRYGVCFFLQTCALLFPFKLLFSISEVENLLFESSLKVGTCVQIQDQFVK